MEEKELKEIVQAAIVPKLRSQFMFGCLTGWMAACKSIDGKTKKMTSAKAMKDVIKQMCKEADDKLAAYEAKNNSPKEEEDG